MDVGNWIELAGLAVVLLINAFAVVRTWAVLSVKIAQIETDIIEMKKKEADDIDGVKSAVNQVRHETLQAIAELKCDNKTEHNSIAVKLEKMLEALVEATTTLKLTRPGRMSKTGA